MLLAEAAEQIGHTVDCASTKTDSEALLEGASPDLAVCNVVLPDGSGYDVAAMALSFGIKSVLITGHQDAGVDDSDRKIAYLRKPFGVRQLQKVITDHLGG